ncbi:XRE family transcriptional regulator [Lolliginicoccus levis]|uniref:XRE family transcriptional regulator n=1 Tax=Lolliginicoccus levis TaxID=2919542 RepID=UPI00241FBC7D|nr:XRE family transcriptional regulator [Lolliginicoccus levis]
MTQPTRAYIAKKRAEGKSTKEAMRCLKRAICREVYRLLTNPPEVPLIDDLRPLRQSRGITLTAAAKHFAVWPAVISTLERGTRRNDDLATIYREWLKAA